MEEDKDFYIVLLSKSGYDGSVLIECMDEYHVNSLREISLEQYKHFCKKKGLLNVG